MGIRYTDGEKVESHILGLLGRASALESTAPLCSESYDDWAVRYHLSPERGNLLSHLDFSGLDVLELGAGMGGVSRGIAERAKSLTVVEGTEARFAALKERLRDLAPRWTGQVANVADVTYEGEFDVVCVVGVLEYSELFMKADGAASPFLVFLRKAARALRPGGVLLLAIENRLGLKYWNGSAEDHTRRTFDGICGYSSKDSAKTFSRMELRALLAAAGFSHLDEQFPFPDYKIPTLVMDAELLEADPALAANLASQSPYDNYGLPRVKYFPDLLAAHSVAQAGLLGDLSNSFLMIGTDDEHSPIRERLLRRKLKKKELAWHYNNFRETPTRTAFRRAKGGLVVDKSTLRAAAPTTEYAGPSFRVHWSGPSVHPVLPGTAVREELLRALYFDGWESAYGRFLAYLRWSLVRWDRGETLAGEAIDAVTRNATVCPGGYECFDLEWTVEGGVSRSWFLLRNVVSFGGDRESFPPDSPVRTLKQLFERTCADLGVAPELKRDIEREAELQSLVSHRGSAAFHAAALERLLETPWIPAAYPRVPRLEERMLRSLLGTGPMRTLSRAANVGLRSFKKLRAYRLQRLAPT